VALRTQRNLVEPADILQGKISNHMLRLTRSALLLLGLAVLPLAAADVTGRWQLKGEVAGNPILADCNFKQDAAKLAGTCKAEGYVVWSVAGELQETKISFHHDVDYQGATYTLNYAGTFNSDTQAKGDIEVTGASGEFTLTRAAGESAQGSASAPAVLSGTWKIEAEVGGETHTGTCTITQEAEKLTGMCKAEGAEATLAGEVKGQTVTWSHKGEYNGEKYTASYKGVVESPSALKGDIDIQPLDASGTFTATKVQ
jgi:hypothetical protein